MLLIIIIAKFRRQISPSIRRQSVAAITDLLMPELLLRSLAGPSRCELSLPGLAAVANVAFAVAAWNCRRLRAITATAACIIKLSVHVGLASRQLQVEPS